MGILSFFRRRHPKTSPETRESAEVVDRGPSGTTVPAPETRAATERIAGGSVHAAILEPVVTEKSALLANRGNYTFRIAPGATKQDVHGAVEAQFRVHVTGVRMVTVPPKVRHRGRTVGAVPGYRKAIVSLREGEQIDLTKELR